MRRDRLPYVLIPVAAFLAILPLILKGSSCGHDFDFHILNWIEAAAQFRHGNLHPRWTVSPAFNAGEPRFLFYPPLSWVIGAILGLILPWAATPTAYTWLALTASGLAMHRLARAHATPTAALLASTLYLANPYMLFTAYERTAYAELLAAAFLPLLFQAILKPRPTLHAIALPVALLWLTNAPAAVMGTYTLALLALIRIAAPLFAVSSHSDHAAGPADYRAQRDRLPPASPRTLTLTTLTGTTLGLSLAAFYILPAAYERRYVQIAMAIIPGMRIDDNTLFHHTGLSEDALAHDAVLHTASVLAILLLAATTIALIAALRKKSPDLLPLAVLTATIAILLTPIAIPVWHHLPELAFLQFPWRLLAILSTVLALAAALAIKTLTLPGKILLPTALALTLALTLPAAHIFYQPCDPTDTVPARLALFQTHAGTDPTDEYTPTTADNDSLSHAAPPFWLSPNPDAPAPPGSTPGPAPRDFTLSIPTPTNLILNLREYPEWHIQLNGRDTPAGPPRDDGLIDVPLPPGTIHVQATFRSTPLEYAADTLTLLALVLLTARKPLTNLLKSPQ